MNSQSAEFFYRWTPAACLRVSGEDARSFMQGQFTNDLQHAGRNGSVYGLWLNQKGKVVADSFVVRESDQSFLVVSYFSPAETIRERLEPYVIADDVVIEDVTADMVGFTIDSKSAVKPAAGAASFEGRRGGAATTEIIGPRETGGEFAKNFSGWHEMSSIQIERRRIAAKIPAIPRDIGLTELPNEGGLEDVAISYTKGCYLGQEVIARLKSMGQVRRRLLRVSGSGDLPSLPSDLFQKGRKVGQLRSAVGSEDGKTWEGLALITLMHASTDEPLAVGEPAISTATITSLP